MKRKLLICFIACSALLMVGLVASYEYLQNFAQKTIRLNKTDPLFTLKRGTSISEFVKQVEEYDLVGNSYLIPFLMKVHPSLKNIKSGTYQLSPNMTVEQFLQLLNSGKEAQFAVKFVEGKVAKEWLATLKSTPHIVHSLANFSLDEIANKLNLTPSIEGWLYPDTYHYTANTPDWVILKRAQQKMQTMLQTVWDSRDEGLPYKTPYELLIMASIIEKETSVDTERGKVASVFINRLNDKMQLQTDPTVIYGMGENYTGQILSKHLRDKTNPYNTYVISGLPPTPIAMPSLASLTAAAHPDRSNYFYFVADGYGGHIFSTNYADHKKAVNQYWQLMRQRSTTKDTK